MCDPCYSLNKCNCHFFLHSVLFIHSFEDLAIVLQPFAMRAVYECLSPFCKMADDMWFDPFVWMNPFYIMEAGKSRYFFKNVHDAGKPEFFNLPLLAFNLLAHVIFIDYYMPWDIIKPFEDPLRIIRCMESMTRVCYWFEIPCRTLCLFIMHLFTIKNTRCLRKPTMDVSVTWSKWT